MIDISTLTMEEFKRLPPVIEGESKEVRYAGRGLVIIRFKPTIYSYTANRCGVVEGSEALRLKAVKIFLDLLRKWGIKHAYREVNERFVLADLVLPTEAEYAKYGQPVFTPSDLSPEEMKALPKAPPIEVVLKRFHGGTSKHRYKHMNGQRVREGHPLFAGEVIEVDKPYPRLIVRFDWRNPFRTETGERCADEILPEEVADFFIDVKKASITARRIYDALEDFLGARDVICNDLCLFIAEDGETVYGEISQDCGRFRHFDLGSLDKDVWRAGGSSEQVLAKWQTLLEIMEQAR